MTLDKPFFMTNDKWYFFDTKKGIYVLTPEATEKAKESYKKFYDQFDEVYHRHANIVAGVDRLGD